MYGGHWVLEYIEYVHDIEYIHVPPSLSLSPPTQVLARKGSQKVGTKGEQSDSASATPPTKTSESQSGTESRQEKPAACSIPGKTSAAKGTVPGPQQHGHDSKPESSPNSSPESKHKVEGSLPRYMYCSVVYILQRSVHTAV